MGLGMPEVVLILVIALIVFGPRKLPELGKSLGQAMSQFRRASEDFKRTWEQEVEVEKVRKNDSTSGSGSNDSYNESYDPYNSYSDQSYGHDSHHAEAETHSNDAASTHKKAEAEPAAAGAETAAVKTPPDKKHWI
jgi:TatA/E family protein of Tat protein translocase